MELRQEWKFHFGNMKSSFAEARKKSPQRGIVLAMIIVVVCAWAAGFMQGFSTQLSEGMRQSQQSDAIWRMAEMTAESKGDFLLRERFRRQAIDRAVALWSSEQHAPAWRRMANNFMYAKVLRLRAPEDVETATLRRIAEIRLNLLMPPQAETLEKFRERGIADAVAGIEGGYADKATAYSLLLGREIKPRDLLTDGDLRSHLKLFEGQRAALNL
jgi:hypothetical protein